MVRLHKLQWKSTPYLLLPRHPRPSHLSRNPCATSSSLPDSVTSTKPSTPRRPAKPWSSSPPTQSSLQNTTQDLLDRFKSPGPPTPSMATSAP
ncbi:ribosomal RNA-processing protein [Histoplasma capsulatum]|uniref:Ribosomal RNA-processing protein n=1 Tax=Ajellomyces capsulatus TaxID=5037 RepID=A0A8A1MGE6_AJECA|nr:ribosomal RNA-processing protein [Histoplasma capsulatum]